MSSNYMSISLSALKENWDFVHNKIKHFETKKTPQYETLYLMNSPLLITKYLSVLRK